jgi:hypothetical protein
LASVTRVAHVVQREEAAQAAKLDKAARTWSKDHLEAVVSAVGGGP